MGRRADWPRSGNVSPRSGASSRSTSGVGMSDPVPPVTLPTIDAWIDDVRAVMTRRAASAQRCRIARRGDDGPRLRGDPPRPPAP